MEPARATPYFMEPAPRLVTSFGAADTRDLIVSLFCKDDLVRAWYVGPASFGRHGQELNFVPPESQMIACFALLRAHQLAVNEGWSISIVDPERLWPSLWDATNFKTQGIDPPRKWYPAVKQRRFKSASESTVRYLGVDINDALAFAEGTEL